MAGDEAFQVEGRVMEALPNGTFRVELANGHRLTAFVAGRGEEEFCRLEGRRQSEIAIDALRFVSMGRILVETKTI